MLDVEWDVRRNSHAPRRPPPQQHPIPALPNHDPTPMISMFEDSSFRRFL